MLGFLKRTTKPRVEASRRAPPTDGPRAILAECRALVRQGRWDRAMDAARAGVERFPRSREMADQLRLIWRQVGRGRELELVGRVDGRGDGGDFSALIDHYGQAEELDLALGVADRFCAANPDSPDAVAARARILWRRFTRDHVAADGLAAVRSWLLVVERKPNDSDAHLALAEAYYYVGAVASALHHVYALLDLRANDPDGECLKDCLTGLPLETSTIDVLIQTVEDRDRPFDAWRPRDRRRLGAAPGLKPKLSRALRGLSELGGVERVAFVHPAHELVAMQGQVREADSSEPDPFLALAGMMRRTVSVCARRIGIGAFQETEIVSGRKTIVVVGGWSALVLVVAITSSHLDAVREAARDVAAAVDRSR